MGSMFCNSHCPSFNPLQASWGARTTFLMLTSRLLLAYPIIACARRVPNSSATSKVSYLLRFGSRSIGRCLGGSVGAGKELLKSTRRRQIAPAQQKQALANPEQNRVRQPAAKARRVNSRSAVAIEMQHPSADARAQLSDLPENKRQRVDPGLSHACIAGESWELPAFLRSFGSLHLASFHVGPGSGQTLRRHVMNSYLSTEQAKAPGSTPCPCCHLVFRLAQQGRHPQPASHRDTMQS
jgi:hypothetical protein